VLLADDGQQERQTFTDNGSSATDGFGNEDRDESSAAVAHSLGTAPGRIDLHL
jgi:hypothetical protein